MKKLLLIALVLFTASATFAQSRIPTKIGYVNYSLLRDTLPEMDTIRFQLQNAQYGFEADIQELSAEIQRLTRRKDSAKNAELKEYLVQDITEKTAKLNQTYKQAEYVIGQYQQEALAQLNYIISAAVNKVAKSRNYTLVLDSSTGSIVYGLPQDDLTQAVARALNIRI